MSNIEAVITKLEKYQRIADRCADILREEVPIGPTRRLRDSITVQQLSQDTWVVTAAPVAKDGYHYARTVNDGRGPVTVKNAKWLTFDGYAGGQTSIHSPDPDVAYRLKKVGPAAGNDFRQRTIDRLLQEYAGII